MPEWLQIITVAVVVVSIIIVPVFLGVHFGDGKLGYTYNANVVSLDHVVLHVKDDWFGGTTVVPYWRIDGRWSNEEGHIVEKDGVLEALNNALRRHEIKTGNWVPEEKELD